MQVRAHSDTRTRVGTDAVPTVVARPWSAWLTFLAATVCTVAGHRAFTDALPVRAQCCSRCYTLRGEDHRRWAPS